MEPVILNNRYKLEGRLGTGGMAMVYRARDLLLERAVAIKLLRADFGRDSNFQERFRQEAKAAANLSHPNIVTVHDFGVDSEQLFIVMEYVPGVDLKTLLQRRGRLPVEEATALMIQACAGIGYAHRSGLVHCDVKPQNMLVTPDNRLKVTDFGIARALASISPDEKADVVWGSPQYFSPEQAAGGAPSPASDVYSLGIVLYEMTTGQLPFTASSPEDLARLHRESLPASPRKFNPAISFQLEQIMLKVLSKEPSARYRTADQLGRVLVASSQSAKPAPAAGNSAPQPISAETPRSQSGRDEKITPTVGAMPAAPRPGQAASVAPKPGASAQQFASQPAAVVAKNPLDIDWLTWMLGLMTLIMVGGLIPFCLWVYYVLYPPLGR